MLFHISIPVYMLTNLYYHLSKFNSNRNKCYTKSTSPKGFICYGGYKNNSIGPNKMWIGELYRLLNNQHYLFMNRRLQYIFVLTYTRRYYTKKIKNQKLQVPLQKSYIKLDSKNKCFILQFIIVSNIWFMKIFFHFLLFCYWKAI